MRTPSKILLLVITAALFACGGGNSPECKQRAAELNRRVEVLKQKAHEALKIGGKRDVVERFYKDNQIPFSFGKFGASGAIHTSGCSPRGCGSNDAIIVVEVPLDQEGKVKNEVSIMAAYTDCL